MLKEKAVKKIINKKIVMLEEKAVRKIVMIAKMLIMVMIMIMIAKMLIMIMIMIK